MKPRAGAGMKLRASSFWYDLKRRAWNLLNRCFLCKSDKEMTTLFLQCSEVRMELVMHSLVKREPNHSAWLFFSEKIEKSIKGCSVVLLVAS